MKEPGISIWKNKTWQVEALFQDEGGFMRTEPASSPPIRRSASTSASQRPKWTTGEQQRPNWRTHLRSCCVSCISEPLKQIQPWIVDFKWGEARRETAVTVSLSSFRKTSQFTKSNDETWRLRVLAVEVAVREEPSCIQMTTECFWGIKRF